MRRVLQFPGKSINSLIAACWLAIGLALTATMPAMAQDPGISGLIIPSNDPLTPEVTINLESVNEESPTLTLNFSREDFDNPLVEIRTSLGIMILELFPEEAPLAVENFLGLAEGTKAWIDPLTGLEMMQPFYDGLVFHRVIDGFMIQGGSPTGDGTGTPGFTFRDEINARSLGLDKMQALNDAGEPHTLLAIDSQADFQQKMLVPLYEKLGITSQAQLENRIDEVNRALQNMTVKESLENLGYRYSERYISRMPVRGVIAMANSGPDSNGSQFFINLVDTDWLTGRHTVFGKVRAGLDVLDAIGSVPVDENNRPLEDVTILSIRQINL